MIIASFLPLAHCKHTVKTGRVALFICETAVLGRDRPPLELEKEMGVGRKFLEHHPPHAWLPSTPLFPFPLVLFSHLEHPQESDFLGDILHFLSVAE